MMPTSNHPPFAQMSIWSYPLLMQVGHAAKKVYCGRSMSPYLPMTKIHTSNAKHNMLCHHSHLNIPSHSTQPVGRYFLSSSCFCLFSPFRTSTLHHQGSYSIFRSAHLWQHTVVGSWPPAAAAPLPAPGLDLALLSLAAPFFTWQRRHKAYWHSPVAYFVLWQTAM